MYEVYRGFDCKLLAVNLTKQQAMDCARVESKNNPNRLYKASYGFLRNHYYYRTVFCFRNGVLVRTLKSKMIFEEDRYFSGFEYVSSSFLEDCLMEEE